jgi:carboxymethylenebutenolidase
MGERIELTSAFDGFVLGAYHARPSEPRRGGLVLIQEIFGVNADIRRMADGFAADGYEVIAPRLFDRIARDIDLEPGPASRDQAIACMKATPPDQVMGDLRAAIAALAPPVFVVGYCFGGSMAWLAATRLPGIAAAACFYGRLILDHADEQPLCPTQLHFGKTDHTIPLEQAERVAEAHPELQTFFYDAGHGFHREGNPADADAARLGKLRTLQFFHRAAGKAEMGG